MTTWVMDGEKKIEIEIEKHRRSKQNTESIVFNIWNKICVLFLH